MKFIQGSLIFIFALSLCGCSSSTPFLIVNKGNTAVFVEIDIPRQKAGAVLFSPFSFRFFPIKNGELDGENWSVFSPKTAGDAHEFSLPAQTAIEIGHLNNQKYENSKQNFINGRVFNLKKLRAAKIEIDKENFDQYFKKTDYGIAWEIP